MALSLEEYMQKVPWERMERFTELLYRIKAWFPESELSMKYKMPTFELEGNWVAIANQKNYISVYTCSFEHIEPYVEKHPEIKRGKGCLNFRDKDGIDYDDLRQVVENAIKGK